ncbi:iron-sulfur cluster protein [Natranaerovirga pectinivora]|uniref:Iron-sulfur cluster protein n=1 Tax=Natranaerovirga pectinivora TaxID=682400 RepID=A0A4R3MPF1_9FIRM|nr:SPASM domain-containing protein [Natranaerovirga pectinivora]TCT17165.1 iron-sulfur cluster protein [Natranaerovirga pectinivora]
MPYTEPLDSIRSVSIKPNGEVMVCKDFSIGNIKESDILEIINNYDPYNNLYMDIILKDGIQGLLKKAEDKGVFIEEKEFFSTCDMCVYLRKIV